MKITLTPTSTPYRGQGQYVGSNDATVCHCQVSSLVSPEQVIANRDFIVKACNEHAALVAVAVAAEKWIKAINFPDNKNDVRRYREVVEGMLTNLDAVRGVSGTTAKTSYEAELRAYEEAHRVWMDTPVHNNSAAKAAMIEARDVLEAARKAVAK